MLTCFHNRLQTTGDTAIPVSFLLRQATQKVYALRVIAVSTLNTQICVLKQIIIFGQLLSKNTTSYALNLLALCMCIVACKMPVHYSSNNRHCHLISTYLALPSVFHPSEDKGSRSDQAGHMEAEVALNCMSN